MSFWHSDLWIISARQSHGGADNGWRYSSLSLTLKDVLKLIRWQKCCPSGKLAKFWESIAVNFHCLTMCCSGWSDLCEGWGVRLGVDGLWREADRMEGGSDLCGEGEGETLWLVVAELAAVGVWEQLSLLSQLSVCKDLQLPSSDFAYSADLISINSSSPLKTAPIQVISSYSSAKLNGFLLWSMINLS